MAVNETPKTVLRVMNTRLKKVISLEWDRIIKALETRGVSGYLTRMAENHVQNRILVEAKWYRVGVFLRAPCWVRYSGTYFMIEY